jgi:hypothetical protein
MLQAAIKNALILINNSSLASSIIVIRCGSQLLSARHGLEPALINIVRATNSLMCIC